MDEPSDAGPTAAGSSDAGPTDAGPTDAGDPGTGPSGTERPEHSRGDSAAHRADEAERDELLATLLRLDEDAAAGDLDAEEADAVRDDLTLRLAAVLRRLDAPARPAQRSRRSEASTGTDEDGTQRAEVPLWRRRGNLAVVATLVIVAVVGGVLVAQSAGTRAPGGAISGATGFSERLDACRTLRADSGAEIDCYEQLVEERPDDIEALTYSGWALARAGRTDEATARFDRVVKVDPSYPDVRVFRASVALRSGDAEAAQDELDAFWASDPPPGMVTILRDQNLESAVAEANLPDNVRRCWKTVDDAASAAATTTTPGQDLPDLESALGLTDGLKCFDDLIEANPDDVVALTTQGLVFTALGQGVFYDRAVQRLNAALKIDPEEPTALLLSAGIANAQDRPELAIKLLDRFDEVGERPSGLLPPEVTADAIRQVAEGRLDAGPSPTSTTQPESGPSPTTAGGSNPDGG
ncbi:MAG: tetratricopeptide repeat protein [Candidatus Microthrix sp.]|jgi:tetratricopeptide (TPR) repeat protein|nr:tetratricopeptide repeat protein [Candidatus Microthrix sp.]MBK7166810.1 tetratricopeptide repeat protein [Candidatus Microthrix sp.]